MLPAYVDGLAPSKAAAIAAHLETCAACRELAHAQSVARTVLKARAAQLCADGAAGTAHAHHRQHADLKTSPRQGLEDPPVLAWTGRLTAFAAAAMVVLTLGAVLLPVATVRSTAVLAAQLALDHLKCFTIDGDADGEPIPAAQAEATLKQEFDFTVTVPASLAPEQLELLAVRRCLYGDGRAAHVLYRLDGEPVSLFIIPGLARPAAELSLFGHDQVVWTQGIGPTCWCARRRLETTWPAWRLTSRMRQNRGMEEQQFRHPFRRAFGRPFERRANDPSDRPNVDAHGRRRRDRDRAARRSASRSCGSRTSTPRRGSDGRRSRPRRRTNLRPAQAEAVVHGGREARELGFQVEGHRRQGSRARVVQGTRWCC